MRRLLANIAALAAIALALAILGPRPESSEARAAPPAIDGGELYAILCAACHGKRGDGRGPAAPWLWPRPRDFTRGDFKWKTTPTGNPPAAADIARAIRFGAPGTSMPGFGDVLSKSQIAALVEVVQGFAPRPEIRPRPLDIPAPPADPSRLVARGKALYGKLGCALCHGESGRGDGASAASLTDAQGLPARPYDLTAHPFRRPRANDASTLRAIFTSLKTGLAGTPMPAYDAATSDRELWAVSAYVATLVPGRAPRLNGADEVHPVAQKLDRGDDRVRAGYYPGRGDPAAMLPFGEALALQGKPPPALAPAQASLHPRQCARCHAEQWRAWRQSLHAQAASPGLLAQTLPMTRRGKHGTVGSCQRCHAPLAEQHAMIRGGQKSGFTKNAAFDDQLLRAGITCAGCHVRSWQRLGPPRSPAAQLPHLPSYPLTELAIYERSDFCLPCHQLAPRNVVNGKPLLNTYREWLEGPYMRRGIQCQACHMPGREHTWKGVHDPDTVRQGIALEAGATRHGSRVQVSASLENIGAGHYLPTTPTPAMWLEIQLVDNAGTPIPGAEKKRRIGRHITYKDGGFVELADTRIPPGKRVKLEGAWQGPGAQAATAAVITVRVFPDEYYERFYTSRLGQKLPADARRLYERALARARAARYIAITRTVPIR